MRVTTCVLILISIAASALASYLNDDMLDVCEHDCPSAFVYVQGRMHIQHAQAALSANIHCCVSCLNNIIPQSYLQALLSLTCVSSLVSHCFVVSPLRMNIASTRYRSVSTLRSASTIYGLPNMAASLVVPVMSRIIVHATLIAAVEERMP